MALPHTLSMNAWTGDQVATGELSANGLHWLGDAIEMPVDTLRPEPVPDNKHWRHPEVGWGLVLPDRPALTPAASATAADAPEPIRELVNARQAPVFRYVRELPEATAPYPKGTIRRYYADGKVQDVSLVASPRGVGTGCLPRYLLIYGSPQEIPWKFQYRLQAVAHVGRIALEDGGLENYVSALLRDWTSARSDVRSSVVWAVDHGANDITRLMRNGIAAKVYAQLSGDPDLKPGARFIDGRSDEATGPALIDALASANPALVVTTSHGQTGPLDDSAALARTLGLPVGADYQPLDVTSLLERWQPSGAIWYAHACCSAGADSCTAFEGLLDELSTAMRVLRGVAAGGARISPLPQALLGARYPLRAFVGHVEPTFDWTLRQNQTGQLLTSSIVDALHRHLYQPEPVGFALGECHRHGPQLNSMHIAARNGYLEGQDRLDEALAARLMAVDRESLVILGDPTVTLPCMVQESRRSTQAASR